jgi:hypothetical protein
MVVAVIVTELHQRGNRTSRWTIYYYRVYMSVSNPVNVIEPLSLKIITAAE